MRSLVRPDAGHALAVYLRTVVITAERLGNDLAMRTAVQRGVFLQPVMPFHDLGIEIGTQDLSKVGKHLEADIHATLMSATVRRGPSERACQPRKLLWVKPVEPMTIARPCSAQALRCRY